MTAILDSVLADHPLAVMLAVTLLLALEALIVGALIDRVAGKKL